MRHLGVRTRFPSRRRFESVPEGYTTSLCSTLFVDAATELLRLKARDRLSWSDVQMSSRYLALFGLAQGTELSTQ